MPRAIPARDYLAQCFDYDPATGVLTWRSRPRDHFRSPWSFAQFDANCAGRPAGYIAAHGYVVVGLDGVPVYAHRIIWRLLHDEEPPPIIDHKDGDKTNNRPGNLRRASQSQNLRNATMGFQSKYGLPKGVTFDRSRGKFVAQMSDGNKRVFLGRFSTAEEASDAYKAAAGEFAKER